MRRFRKCRIGKRLTLRKGNENEKKYFENYSCRDLRGRAHHARYGLHGLEGRGGV
jgi:hypothetical protein